MGALQNRAPLSIRKIFLLLITVIAAHCENYSCGEGHLEIALQVSMTFLFPLCVLPNLVCSVLIHCIGSPAVAWVRTAWRASVALALELHSQSLGVSRSGLEPENLHF